MTANDVWRARAKRKMEKCFLGAHLGGINLNGIDLSGAELTRADLNGTRLRGANLCGADLRETDLRGADLFGANLHEARLSGAVLDDATNIDFVGWPIDCGSLDLIVGVRQARQFAYHFCGLWCGDPEFIVCRDALVDFANKFHRAGVDCEKLKKIGGI